MKKRRNRSKRKNKISYRSIIASGILIVAFIIFISFAFSNNRNYEVIIIDEQGNEDKEKSRRVEFRIVTNSDEIINEIIEGYEQ